MKTLDKKFLPNRQKIYSTQDGYLSGYRPMSYVYNTFCQPT